MAQHSLLDRLLQLTEPLQAYFGANPSGPAVLPSDWRAIREAASILDPAVEVVTKVRAKREEDTDKTPLLAEAINLYANLHQSFVYPTQDIRSASERDGSVVSRQVEELTPEARIQLGVLAKDMEEMGLGRAREDAEAASMVLDPRFKTCCPMTCVNGGNTLKLRALTVVTSQLRKFEGSVEPERSSREVEGGGSAQKGGSAAGGARMASSSLRSSQGGGGAAPEVKLSRLEKMRQAQDFALGHSLVRGGLGAGGGSGSGRHAEGQRAEDAVRELGEYMLESAGRRHELLAYWKLHGTDTLDSGTGKVVLAARWPHLALLARLYAGVDATSQQGEGGFDGGSGGFDFGHAVGALLCGVLPRQAEQMVLLRLNKHLIPEVAEFFQRGKEAEGDL